MLSINHYNYILNGLQQVHQEQGITDQSGWFDETTFTDWFFTLMLLTLRKQEGKKVLIGENLSSHLSRSVIDACSKHNIAFACLFPNATHLLQTT